MARDHANEKAYLRLHKPNWRELGLEMPTSRGDFNPIRPPPPEWRSTSSFLLGDPPIGRSALDEKLGKIREASVT